MEQEQGDKRLLCLLELTNVDFTTSLHLFIINLETGSQYVALAALKLRMLQLKVCVTLPSLRPYKLERMRVAFWNVSNS